MKTRIACCLILSLMLSNCVSTVHRYVWNRAKVIDKAYWVEDRKNVELYQVGHAYYVKGFMGPARGGQTPITKDAPASIIGMHGGAGRIYTPIQEQATPVYIRVYDYSLDSTLAQAKSDAEKDGKGLWVTWDGTSQYLETLPPHAQKVTQHKVFAFADIHELSHYQSRTDAHKYYAYPLGILLAVGVDIPLTLAGNVILAAGITAGAPVGLTCFASQQLQTQSTPD
ncbi:MAG: hypothetical protein E7031_03000 [Akkermansiaceae bacterium]|nr:hypothetical protein [Akkermansiaceae bacterium]